MFSCYKTTSQSNYCYDEHSVCVYEYMSLCGLADLKISLSSISNRSTMRHLEIFFLTLLVWEKYLTISIKPLFFFLEYK